MPAEEVITGIVILLTLALLITERFAPSGVMLASLAVLVLTNVVDPAEGFSGFSSQAPLTVAALYVVAAAARRTGVLAGLTRRVLGGSGGTGTLSRLCFPVAGLSALFNNTPLVAMLLPEVGAWARARRLPVSRYFMPLSFATILGGTVTLIGTSTNLVVSGALEQQGHKGLGVFEQTPIGLPVAIVGLVLLVTLGIRLLPDRIDPAGEAMDSLRNFALHLEVSPAGPFVGRSVSEAGLRHLSGVFLADIVRGDRHLGPISPEEVLAEHDLLIFVGDATDVLDLRSRPGLIPPSEQNHVLDAAVEPLYFEAVIGRESPLVGNSLKDVGGRTGYRAAAVAIHRAGEQVHSKLGEVELKAGDTLILLAGSDLREARRAAEDFLVIAPLADLVPVVSRKAGWVAAALAAFVLLASTQLVSTLEAALVAAGIVVISGVITFSEAKRSVNIDVVLMIASALGIGRAIEASGLAADVASFITHRLQFAGTAGVVLGIMLTTSLLTEIVSNNAAAAIVIPIALRASEAVGIDYRIMAVGVAVMASASFLTPIGYQTNAMIYGPGGYRFSDFIRVGGIINLAVVLSTTALVMMLG